MGGVDSPYDRLAIITYSSTRKRRGLTMPPSAIKDYLRSDLLLPSIYLFLVPLLLLLIISSEINNSENNFKTNF